MPNVMLTTRCNFHCPYCFGLEYFRSLKKNYDIEFGTFAEILTWLDIEPYHGRTLHLMGGEPTLHNDFVELVDMAVAQRFAVSVFSNAAAESSPAAIERVLSKPIQWIINVNPPDTRDQRTERHLHDSLRLLAARAVLTLNISPGDPPTSWIIDYIYEFGLSKRIKVGMTLPTLSHTNVFLDAREYPAFTEQLVRFAQLCDSYDISLEYECGIERCIFSAEQLGMLWKTNSELSSCCNSILDITPDGTIIYCLPLANFVWASFRDFRSYGEAKKWFEANLCKFRPLGSTQNCCTCILLKNGMCRGGCLAKSLHGVHNLRSISRQQALEAAPVEPCR